MENKKHQTQPIGQQLQQQGTLDYSEFSHIELTSEETERALNYWRMLKSRQIEQDAKAERRRKVIAEAMRPWSTEELDQHVWSRAEGLPFRFKLDKDNEHVFKLLCLYFSGNPEFEKHGFKSEAGEVVQQYSLQKGICLHSQERGTGKTILMELFAQNKKGCYVILPTAKITRFFEADGDKVITRYSKPWAGERDPRFFYQSPVGLCFDDFGDEEIKNHYGNKENVMYRIITSIYSDYSENPGKVIFPFFHITTNLTGNEIEAKYDKRVRSRMREMFNWIELPGKDRRR
jgi:hypothetical protein